MGCRIWPHAPTRCRASAHRDRVPRQARQAEAARAAGVVGSGADRSGAGAAGTLKASISGGIRVTPMSAGCGKNVLEHPLGTVSIRRIERHAVPIDHADVLPGKDRDDEVLPRRVDAVALAIVGRRDERDRVQQVVRAIDPGGLLDLDLSSAIARRPKYGPSRRSDRRAGCVPWPAGPLPASIGSWLITRALRRADPVRPSPRRVLLRPAQGPRSRP